MRLSLEGRFERYCDAMVRVLAHADREQPGRWYLKGLVLPGGRKSVEPMAARVQPGNVPSAHQSMHHLVADAEWSDTALLAAVGDEVLPALLEADEPCVWIVNGYYSARKYPEHLRRIRFKDPESGKTLVFLTNNTALPPLTIGALYKSRWQVELFFKWIKQHLRIKHFLGTSENAVKTQLWRAVATYVLIAIVKKELQLNASLYTCLQILSVSAFNRTVVSNTIVLGVLLPTPKQEIESRR